VHHFCARCFFASPSAGADNEAVKNVTMWRAAVVIIKPRRKKEAIHKKSRLISHTHTEDVNKYYNISAGVKMRNNCWPEEKKRSFFFPLRWGVV
jgi:hypothetical protein